jgi:protein TonB
MRRALILLVLLLGTGCAAPPTNEGWTPEQQAEVSAWMAAVGQRLYDHGYYPRDRRNPLARPEGRLTVRFDVFPDGRVGTPQVVQSSGSPLLDGAALTAVLTAAPYPPPPAHALKDGTVSLNVPVRYQVRQPGMVP